MMKPYTVLCAGQVQRLADGATYDDAIRRARRLANTQRARATITDARYRTISQVDPDEVKPHAK